MGSESWASDYPSLWIQASVPRQMGAASGYSCLLGFRPPLDVRVDPLGLFYLTLGKGKMFPHFPHSIAASLKCALDSAQVRIPLSILFPVFTFKRWSDASCTVLSIVQGSLKGRTCLHKETVSPLLFSLWFKMLNGQPVTLVAPCALDSTAFAKGEIL